MYEGAGLYDIAEEAERQWAAAAVDIGALAQHSVSPAPATTLGFTFGTPVTQVAPAPIARNSSRLVDLFSLAIRPSRHHDDVIISMNSWTRTRVMWDRKVRSSPVSAVSPK
jgi:hypothetical protein